MNGSPGCASECLPLALEPSLEAHVYHLTGAVQGVGFRPFVYRLSRRFGLVGWVYNDASGVTIHAEGSPKQLRLFARALKEEAPPAAVIQSLRCSPVRPMYLNTFTIRQSAAARSSAQVRVPADRVTCSACLSDVNRPGDRRADHPFTTCTDCGPRYSIIHAMPYDRPATTMQAFPLCEDCAQEYTDPLDRRFHAQPIACPQCGPRLWLIDHAGKSPAHGLDAVEDAARALAEGWIVALKGLGGFQLLVRADSTPAVRRLRQRKHRPGKPLAVLVGTVEQAERFTQIEPEERSLLLQPEGPIVLLRKKGTGILSDEVAPNLAYVGVLLPTTPLHHLLCQRVDFPLVATSGNSSEDPIEIDEHQAMVTLGSIADRLLVHDRPIARRVDDSVVRIQVGAPVLLRLARGYAPMPLPTLERWIQRQSLELPPLLALGGQQKNAIALWTGQQAVLGPHIGDLDSPNTRNAWKQHLNEFCQLYRCTPSCLAVDSHPDYYSRRWAETTSCRMITVQHHHAHAAASMVEHDLLDREVLAFTWDGTGLGSDGTIWGGEVLRASLGGFQRVASLRPFVLPGGEAAIREPSRLTLALLSKCLGADRVLGDARLLQWLGWTSQDARALLYLVAKNLLCPVTTSVGRLFDAVAMLLLGERRVSYEGEAASWLESCATSQCLSQARDLTIEDFGVLQVNGLIQIDWRPVFTSLFRAWERRIPPTNLAWDFHRVLTRGARKVAEHFAELPIVLGGGCFQNRLLSEQIHQELSARSVRAAGLIPPGDGGLAVGQLAVALAQRAQEI